MVEGEGSVGLLVVSEFESCGLQGLRPLQLLLQHSSRIGLCPLGSGLAGEWEHGWYLGCFVGRSRFLWIPYYHVCLSLVSMMDVPRPRNANSFSHRCVSGRVHRGYYSANLLGLREMTGLGE